MAITGSTLSALAYLGASCLGKKNQEPNAKHQSKVRWEMGHCRCCYFSLDNGIIHSKNHANITYHMHTYETFMDDNNNCNNNICNTLNGQREKSGKRGM